MSMVVTEQADVRLAAIRLVQSSRTAWRISNCLLVLLVIVIFSMVFVPWQQTARGTGQVVAFVPQERQQVVTSPSKGLVVRLAEGVIEGAIVKEGDFILEIEPSAANLVEQIKNSRSDLQAKLATAKTKAEVYGQNVVDFEAAKVAAMAGADDNVEAAKSKWQSKQRRIPGFEATLLQAKLNYERQRGLTEKGVQSTRELEKYKKEYDVAIAELESLKLDVKASEEELNAKRQERIQREREAQTRVDYAKAMQQDALGQYATVQKELRDVEIKLSELDRLMIYAPRDGSLLRVNVVERGQLLKEGDELFTIVPDTTRRAVEMWVSGNDTPLIRPGDHVRLQFEGWPAVQFAGWPSVAVGTFGGEVVTMDATDDGNGRFRTLVVPDGEQDWPSEQYLRQGVQANGWVMLNQVPLGYEIWRQLNGFPPTVAPDGSKDGKPKTPKLPK